MSEFPYETDKLLLITFVAFPSMIAEYVAIFSLSKSFFNLKISNCGKEKSSQKSSSQKESCCKTKSESETCTQSCLHEADESEFFTGGNCWQQTVTPHRGDEESLGLHQEEQFTGCEKQTPDQR